MISKLRFPRAFALLLILIVAVGCSRAGNDPPASPAESATATETVIQVTLSPEPTQRPTATPSPTPIPAGVVMDDQTLDEDAVLVAEQVSLPGPGWLVIYRVLAGEADEVIGHQPLAAGVHQNVEVTVDADLATEELLAGVHMDGGAEGVFEFPGEDEPFPGEPETAFTVELLLPRPRIEVADQAIAENGVLTLAAAEFIEPTWVLIHADEDGEIGPVVGRRLMEPGVHENVPLTIDWRRATPVLYAVLHEDSGETGLMEFPDGDMPILWNGAPIVASFKATYPPEVLVYDQPVIDGAITVERAISEGPGWVVIYNEAEGQPGFIIGTEALEDGLNEGITVALLEAAITPQLFARLHQDTEAGDAFNFPGQDPPVLFNNRLPNAAAFRTDNGAHAFVYDQELGENNTLSIATIITPVNAWAAIYTVEEGLDANLLGHTWLPAGVNREVIVELEDEPEPGALHLVLYRDLGAAQEFEDSDIDLVLTDDDNQPIRIPFTLK